MFDPRGYVVQGFVANLTATGPVGVRLGRVGFDVLTVRDWTGPSYDGGMIRLSADPPATRIIVESQMGALGGKDVIDWKPISLSPPGLLPGGISPTFRISC